MPRHAAHLSALLLALPLLVSATPSLLLLPADRRPALPRFTALEGFRVGESLSPDELRGHVAVINIWYEY
ncbi:MAG: hypothetical protein AB2A00_21970 [Myxococcota bacterium]